MDTTPTTHAETYHYHLGILVGLASAANAEIARLSSLRVGLAHAAEIADLTAEIADLRAQLAALPTPEDMRVLAAAFADFGTMSYEDWPKYDAFKAATIARWTPRLSDPTGNRDPGVIEDGGAR